MNAREAMTKSVEGVGGLCEKALHGGGCKDAECISGCKALFGKEYICNDPTFQTKLRSMLTVKTRHVEGHDLSAQGTGRSTWKIGLGWEAAWHRSSRVGLDWLTIQLASRLTAWLAARLVKSTWRKPVLAQ
ncbi:hypothetical protein E6C27_scaffold3980G00030 [Cucumis melo var. makuwa]|uniref:Uncharacterized protein n=1 Tax=Cucumis melo var. makuwa TaxID=1194695 RepID=A0A5A7V2X9_CUCMM|nr:hypothetical protein E6C27_scaffold3980G00030 [Cucumis melo var. makuwa]